MYSVIDNLHTGEERIKKTIMEIVRNSRAVDIEWMNLEEQRPDYQDKVTGGAGLFSVIDGCDNCFGCFLTANQLLAWSKELRDLALEHGATE